MGHELIPNAYCSMVYTVESPTHGPCVLKVPVVGEERTTGFNAALAFQGHGGAPVLEAEADSGSVLLPLLNRDRNLVFRPEDESMQIALDLMNQLHAAPKFQGTLLQNWHVDPRPPDFSTDLWDSCKSLIARLLETTTETRGLHGDLHHDNILPNSEGNYFAIDPKGVIGDPAFECVAYIRNPVEQLPKRDDLPELMAKRINFFSRELNLDPSRIWAWSYADITLSSAESPGPFTTGCSAISKALWAIKDQFS